MSDFNSSFNKITAPKVEIYTGVPVPKPVPPQKPRPRKKKRRWLGIVAFVLLLAIIGAGVLLTTKAANLSNKIFVGQTTSFFQKVKDLISASGNDDQSLLQGEDQGQINILLLGIGGAGHDGPYLTDTMIVAEIKPAISSANAQDGFAAGQVTLTSIPRDYFLDIGHGYGDQKINAAFAYGFVQNQDYNQAGQWAMQIAQQVTGLNIPYFAVMDFSGFRQAVDEVGGLDINVPIGFTDYAFPADQGDGYMPPITFTVGEQHMDGERALEYARSRHAEGSQGSDFARSQRQQLILQAFETKVFGENLFGDVNNMNKLLDVFADHFHTNLSPAEIYHLYTLVKDQNAPMTSQSLDPTTGLICSETLATDGAYILTPCYGKSTQDIQNFFSDSFYISGLRSENATVLLANATGNTQTLDTAKRILTDAGIAVQTIAYPQTNQANTIVYTSSSTPTTVQFAEDKLNARATTTPPADINLISGKTEVVIILGQDAPSEPAPTPYIPPPAYKPTTTQTTTASTTPMATSTPMNASSSIMVLPITNQNTSSSTISH